MIYPGDILCVRGVGWLSDGIAKAEYAGFEPAKSATHVGIFITGSPAPIVVEALARVKTNPLLVSIASAYKAYAMHDISITDEQRQAIVNEALRFSANSYGWFDLFAQLADASFSTTWFTNRMAGMLKRWPICSYVVGSAYDKIGLNFGVDTASVRPSDILRFGLANPALYSVAQLKP